MEQQSVVAGGSNKLFDTLIVQHQLKNDAGLARALKVSPPVISKIRHQRLPFGAGLILAVHETFNVPVKEIRAYVAA